MTYQPDTELKAIAARVNEKKGNTHKTTPRALLQHFGVTRRKINVVSAIDAALANLNVYTQPDYKGEWIDGEVLILMETKSFKVFRMRMIFGQL